jgi:hypothetical protein
MFFFIPEPLKIQAIPIFLAGIAVSSNKDDSAKVF